MTVVASIMSKQTSDDLCIPTVVLRWLWSLKNQVDRLTELLERSLDNTQRLPSALATTSGAICDGGDGGPPGPNAAPGFTLGGSTAHALGGKSPAGAASAPVPADSPSSDTHPEGWFYEKLPSFGTCGGKRGSLIEVWQIWGGAGPGKVTRGKSGFSLRAHGETSIKEQEMWGSTSNYERYLQAGTYMDEKIASIKVGARGTGILSLLPLVGRPCVLALFDIFGAPTAECLCKQWNVYDIFCYTCVFIEASTSYTQR